MKLRSITEEFYPVTTGTAATQEITVYDTENSSVPLIAANIVGKSANIAFSQEAYDYPDTELVKMAQGLLHGLHQKRITKFQISDSGDHGDLLATLQNAGLIAQSGGSWTITPPSPEALRKYAETPTTLANAISAWKKYHAGHRWQDLEEMILKYRNCYLGKKGDMIKPRLALFTYLNGLTQRWPEGEAIADQFTHAILPYSYVEFSRYFNIAAPEFLRYLSKYHQPDVLTAFLQKIQTNPYRDLGI